jgi:hypothetical protein
MNMERASAGIMMNFVEIMIGEKLRDVDPALDVMGSDRKVLQVACQDFTNYLKFHWNLIGKEASNVEVAEKLELLFRENADELDAYLNIWVNMWFKKWKQRVKLLIGNQSANKWNKMTKNIVDAEPLWRKLDHKQELQEIVIATLIKNSEICGTEILAENLLKMELGEKAIQDLADDKDKVFTTLNNTLRKAREMANSNGPLIFVKVDKGYYDTAAE